MDKLDEKLKELLGPWHQTGCPFSQDYGICRNASCDKKRRILARDVGQAFKDAGWRDLSSRGGLVRATVVDNIGRTDYMTGQEWYDCFDRELHTDGAVSAKLNVLMDLLKAILDTPRREASVDLWKLHIDGALDRLDSVVCAEAAKKAAGLS